MEKYNQIMEKVWLVMAILIAIAVSYMGVQESFAKWGPYYVLALLALLMFAVKRFFNARMAKARKERELEKNKGRRKNKQ